MHVATVFDGFDDRGIRRRAADALFFHLFHQRRFRVARRWVRRMALCTELVDGQAIALIQLRQALFAAVSRIIIVGTQEPGEGDGATVRLEFCLFTGGGRTRHGDLH